jgi:hypothetical protein
LLFSRQQWLREGASELRNIAGFVFITNAYKISRNKFIMLSYYDLSPIITAKYFP